MGSSEYVIHTSSIIKFLRKKRWHFLVNSVIFVIIGVIYALLAPKEYSSSVKILPELQNKSSLGSFRALADLAGINLDNVQVSEAIRPDLYPSVLESTPFLLKVAELKIASIDLGNETVQDFLARQKSHFDLIKFNLFEGSKDIDVSKKHISKAFPSEILVLTKDRQKLLDDLSNRINASLDKKTGIITINVVMPDPIAAAWIAQYSTEYLIEYMLRYRNNKQAEQATFLVAQRNKAKNRFENAERSLRIYRDKNRNPFLNSSTSDESGLQAELLIAQNLYSELAKQAEQSQIKMKEETPVLKVLEPAKVPIMRSSPKRFQIVIGFLIASFFYSLFIQLLIYSYKKIKGVQL
ncbi:Wzz/FepE/Etk N-terminal domain-containing protein [Siphonobacter sp. BAB-5405]|uniref:Wzz/FepE/Etk N-terminal domain-containing protein n=1 Tax=Siphonobacter sp. BAB-5405 TaxID=1864825 RepID=UPI001304F465|nr:Wzz/FepE/Etk N-terminal domain-containing protein [Siphonobacter sp. BAB-5405]